MQKYELVLLLDYQAQDTTRKDLLSKFESNFKDNILAKDDMWLQEMSHDMKGKKWNNRAYFVSYHINADANKLNEIRKNFLYANLVVRYDVFKMWNEQTFFEFDKLQKELEKIIDSRDDKRFGNKISFFSLDDNSKYINWKAVVILKKYITRFWNIKPRKYTKNLVKVQKKLRKEIIRARTLGLLEFSRK